MATGPSRLRLPLGGLASTQLGSYPCTYVLCTEDNILPPARQREMAARLRVEPVEIPSDHAVFALRPRELAALLV